MILVDSSVWIDVLANRDSPQTRIFDRLLRDEMIVGVGDLIATEVLQGTRSDRDFRDTLATFLRFPFVTIVDSAVSIDAARHYRSLRAKGITVRKTVDTLIATRCIADNIPLLYRDRDFDPFVAHLGLRSALDDTGVN